MSSYANIVGGKLKLKGEVPLTPNHSKKKKKDKKKVIRKDENEFKNDIEHNDNQDKQQSTSELYLTPAEKRHKEKLLKKEKERIDKIINKSHKEKVEEYNKYLSSLSEHHDIPKVGPG